jgi:hypothetical protein
LEPTVIENYEKNNNNVGVAVLTAMVMKSSMFWDITVCNPLQVRIQLFKKNISYQKLEYLLAITTRRKMW